MNFHRTDAISPSLVGGCDARERRQMGKGILMISLALIGLMMVTVVDTLAVADEGVVVVAAFDAASQDLPEGITIDKKGNIYVTMGFPFWWALGDGQIRKISPDGTETELAFFENAQGPAGIVVNAPGDVFFVQPNPFDPVTNGVYQLHGDGSAERLWGSENIVGNGIAFDNHNNLFVSDSFIGAIWLIPANGSGPAYIWSDDESLFGCPFPDDVGANGVAIWKNNVYVANTGKGLLVRIPILDDGSAGAAEVVAGDAGSCIPDELYGLDGIALDVHGTVYALSVLQNTLIRINPNDGSYEVLLTVEDGLYNPASIAFGTGKGDRQSIFIANYALFPDIPDFGGVGLSFGPAVLKFDVGVPGLPLP